MRPTPQGVKNAHKRLAKNSTDFHKHRLRRRLDTYIEPHETDAMTAVLTGHLHLQGKTELIGDNKEGYIVVPIKNDWRKLQL